MGKTPDPKVSDVKTPGLTSSWRQSRGIFPGWRFSCLGRAAGTTLLLLAVLIEGAGPSQGQIFGPNVSETCLTANRDLSLGAPLPRATARLKPGGPFRVVAIGSSSTTGLWVLPPWTYPEVMRQELMRLRPQSQVEAVNSGRVGDTIPGNIRRFDRDVLAYQPDLVIWQLGTNDVAWGGGTDGLRQQVDDGIRTLKSSGADVILMDLQYAPVVRFSSNHTAMQALIASAARYGQVGLFSRYELMRRSVEAGLSPIALVSFDGLHNSSEGYDCIGRALARAVNGAVR